MTFIKNPSWLDKFRYTFTHVDDVDPSTFTRINERLDMLYTEKPEVSIVIIAWNEEINILRCIASLSETRSKHPLEIIVVNNNSTDNTQKTIDHLHVKTYMEHVQGAGAARQKGQENALGKYILTADADCIYPPDWVDDMLHVLKKPGVVCIYGRYSFISDDTYPRWKLYLLEKMKDFIAGIRHFKQPYFNCFGISMGYIKAFGLEIGFIKENRRGEDGQLCMDLMQYGKIKQVRSSKARVWTDTRTLQKDGNIIKVIYLRLLAEIQRFRYNFVKRKRH